MVLKSELNSSNKISSINALAMPVVMYSINILNWQMKEIKKMDAKTRKLFTMHKMHQPKRLWIECICLEKRVGDTVDSYRVSSGHLAITFEPLFRLKRVST